MKTFIKYAKIVKKEYHQPLRTAMLMNLLSRKINMNSVGLYWE